MNSPLWGGWLILNCLSGGFHTDGKTDGVILESPSRLKTYQVTQMIKWTLFWQFYWASSKYFPSLMSVVGWASQPRLQQSVYCDLRGLRLVTAWTCSDPWQVTTTSEHPPSFILHPRPRLWLTASQTAEIEILCHSFSVSLLKEMNKYENREK